VNSVTSTTIAGVIEALENLKEEMEQSGDRQRHEAGYELLHYASQTDEIAKALRNIVGPVNAPE
jgi:hypothetical protein